MSDRDGLSGRRGYWRAAYFFGGLRLQGVLWFLGMFLLLLGERIFGEAATARWVLDGAGLLLVVGALVLVAKGAALAEPEQRPAHRVALLFGTIGLAAVGIYALGSDMVVAAIHFASEEAEQRWRVVVGALWPIAWLAGALPFLAVDRTLAANPLVVVPERVRAHALRTLGLAFAISMLFPLNYAAHDLNKRWDFGYFKTARPGTATTSIVENLAEPVRVVLFYPSNSEVLEELRTYFDQLPKGALQLEIVDHALEPELAKELKVRDNGYIAIVRGEGDDQHVERVKIGKKMDQARRKLKKLDEEFQKALLKVVRGKKTAYFTVGHGEMYWRAGTDPDRKLSNLKKILRLANYNVRELGLTQGLGTEVPEDADIVFVMAPQSEFLPEELRALDEYRRRGGSLLVALEPGGPDLSALLEPVGVRVLDGELVNDTKFVPRLYRPSDRANIFTNKYSTHESVTTLSRNSSVLFTLLPGAAALDRASEGAAEGNKASVAIRSLSDTFRDLDGDFTYDPDTEQRKVWIVALAATGPAERPEDDDAVADEDGGDEAAEEPGDAEDAGDEAKDGDEGKGGDDDALADDEPDEYRVFVIGDATWASDLALPLDPNRGNFQLAIDTLAWLGRELESAGTIESEEDVKIQHTKEGQGWWFYGTAFVVPLGLLGGGLARVRLRRKRGSR